MASSGSPRGPYQTGVRRRQEIIEAAARIFARYGYSGGSLRQIAADVGISSAALLKHFETKEGLLMAVVEYWDIETDHQIGSQVTGLDYFLQQTHTLERHALDSGLTELFLTLTAEASNPRHPAREFLIERYERIIQTGVRHLRVARDRGEVREMDDAEMEMDVRALFAMMDGIQLQWLLNRSIQFVSIFRRYHEVVLEGWTTGVEAGSDPRQH